MTWWIRAWKGLLRAITAAAERRRRAFDKATTDSSKRWRRPVVRVAALALPAGFFGWLVGRLAWRNCEASHPSFFNLGLTFSPSTFAGILRPLDDQCRRDMLLSLVTTDLVFPLFYAFFLSALYLWVERIHRYAGPAEDAQRDDAAVSKPLPSLIVLLPFIAALFDVMLENLPLLWAAYRLPPANAPIDWWTRALVMVGSVGAALKWTALGVYLLGLLTALLRGPRGLVLWRLRFSVLAVLVGAVAILAVPQGQDILQRLVEGHHPRGAAVVAAVAFGLAALVVWYSGRVLTMVRVDRDGEGRREEWPCYFERHIPRALGVAVPTLAGLAFARAGGAIGRFAIVTIVPYLLLIGISGLESHPLVRAGKRLPLSASLRRNDELCDRIMRAVLAVAFAGLIFVLPPRPDALDRWALLLGAWCSVAAAWLVYLFVYFRRDLLAPTGPGVAKWPGPCEGYTPETLPRAARIAALCAIAASLVLLVGFIVEPVRIGWTLGPLLVLVLAVANAVVMGSVLAYFARKTGFPLVTMFVALAVIFSRWNDNHDIRVLPAAPADTVRRPEQLRVRFERWLSVRAKEDAGPIPVILVAAAGGGLRAAYWSSLTLATLQDRDSTFVRHVFAISGVSGGSLGAAAFTAMVRDLPHRADTAECLRPAPADTSEARITSPVRASERAGPTTTCVRRFMRDDFLSPVLAKTVAPDFVQWFLPVPLRILDRARALEQSWEQSYEKWVGDTTFASAYLSLYPDRDSALQTPLLLLNTTHVQTGRRYVTAPFVDDSAFLDARSVHQTLGSDLRLSTAVHNSARFSYVSPAGRIERKNGVSYGALVDGGYFENSGLTTLADVRREVQTVLDSAARKPGGVPSRARVVVLYLCNDPLSCRRDLVTDSSLAAERGLAADWVSPIETLFRTRDARGSFARAALARFPKTDFVQLNVCDSLPSHADSTTTSIVRRRVVQPPLGWLLSRQATDWIDASLPPPGSTPGAVGGRPAELASHTSDTTFTSGARCQSTNGRLVESVVAMLAASRVGEMLNEPGRQ